MNQLKHLKILHTLYQYQWLGTEFMDKISIEKNLFSLHLPNDLERLREVVLKCQLCELANTRHHVVFGEGDPNAKVMFIGEAPGENEDLTGRPFVGRAGQLLTKMIENVLEIKRKEVFIANVVKCRPPNNRVPTPSEAQTCIPYLFKQIELVDPKILVALGATSYRYLTGDKTPISKIRGKVMKFGDRVLIPTFHPSYLLRTPSKKREAYQDLLTIKELLCEV